MEMVCTDNFDAARHTVLVVDNSPDSLSACDRYLSECGFQVLVSRTGHSALRRALAHPPDLMLIEVDLPDMDGFDMFRRLKETTDTRHTMVIFMSRLTGTENKVFGFELGAVDFTIKPFAQEELLARVTTHLKLNDLTGNLESLVRKQTRELISANQELHDRVREKEQIAAALTESESRYRAVIENSNDGICITEVGKIVFFNERLLQILDYDSPDELIGQGVEVLFQPDERGRIKKYNTNREAGLPAPVQYEARGAARDGRRVDFGVSAARITYLDQVAVLSFFKDLTRHNRLKGQLQQAQKMEAIGTLAGGIAHDFNNILNIIIGHTELAMMDDAAQENTRKYLGRVMNASRRASDLVSQILTFSRQKGLEPKPLNIGALVKETLKMLRASLPSTIEIRQAVNDTESLVLADSTQIHQVIMNLCTNASHAMPEGGILDVSLDRANIDLSASLDVEPGAYLKLSVTDNGRGMDADTLRRIFDPYFTTKKLGQGTGLGLSLVHGIVNNCNGAVRVDSAPGKGARFDIFLPVTKDSARSGSTELTIEDLPRGKEHVLFVDDEEMVVTLYEDMMSFLGYRITATTSSTEAWQVFESDPGAFDLVITDLTMPVIAGDELARKMLGLRPDIPVILCTGHSNRLSRAEIEQIGICRYMAKPIILDHLAFAIREVLEAGKGVRSA